MKRNTLRVLLLVLLMLALFAGCADTGEEATQAPETTPAATAESTPEATMDTSVTVTDMTDREITLDQPADKVVAPDCFGLRNPVRHRSGRHARRPRRIL